jgi:CheY-like chemotaxis protein
VKQPPPHIVVADDDPQILKLFTRLLTKHGYSVTPVDSGTGALQALDEQPVDLLVLDLSMPQPDGFDLLKSLRRDRPGLRILVISGFMQGALLKASEILGATASLSKTEAPASLVKTVDALLQ